MKNKTGFIDSECLKDVVNNFAIFRAALETIDRFSDTLDLTDFASRIIHPLVRTLDTQPELHDTAMDVLCSLVMQLGQKFSIFIPMVTKVMTRHKIQHGKYTVLVCRILKVK